MCGHTKPSSKTAKSVISTRPLRLLAVAGYECQRRKFYERRHVASTGDDGPYGELTLNERLMRGGLAVRAGDAIKAMF